MALVWVKSLFCPHKNGDEYRRLLDSERQPPSDAQFLHDKPSPSVASSLLHCRVSPRIISDATIGLSDGLTVPFALTAGLAALSSVELVIYAGFAELCAGAISMGLGGYLGAKGEADGYFAVLEETKACVATNKGKAGDLVRSAFDRYNFPTETLDTMVSLLLSQPDELVDFLMRFHHQLAEADFIASRAYVSGLTIALGYFIGGMIPLLPYLFFARVQEALYCSILVMAIALFAFGYVKISLIGECSRWACFINGIQMLVLGGLAAGAAMACVKAIGG